MQNKDGGEEIIWLGKANVDTQRRELVDTVGLPRISWLLGVIFAIIGVFYEVADITFIIQSMSWYLLSIAAFGSGIINMVAWLGGIYLHGKVTKK